MPRILFIQPTQYGPDGALCRQNRIYLPGLVFPLLAAMTPGHWEVEVKIEVVDEIDYDDPADIVGIGTMGYTIFRGLEIAAGFRSRGKLVVLGGYMASMMADQALEYVDSVIVGDAEIAYPRMLDDYDRTGTIRQRYDDRVESLAGLPVPLYRYLTGKPIGAMLPVQAARGCPHSCSFCSIACMYRGRYLTRPVEEVVRDIREVRDLGFKEFYLIDDNIIGNPAYFRDLCRGIKTTGLKWSTQCSLLLADNPELLTLAVEAGARMMSFGVESITQEGLDRLGKGWLEVSEHERRIQAIAEAGILVSTEMIIGIDSDTIESIRKTYDFILNTRIPIPRFYILTPIPGSPLYEQYRSEGRLITEDYGLYDGSRAVFTPALMSAEQLTEEYWRLNDRIFSIACILFRTLFHPHFWKNPGKYLFAFIVNLHYRGYVRRRVPPNIF